MEVSRAFGMLSLAAILLLSPHTAAPWSHVAARHQFSLLKVLAASSHEYLIRTPNKCPKRTRRNTFLESADKFVHSTDKFVQSGMVCSDLVCKDCA